MSSNRKLVARKNIGKTIASRLEAAGIHDEDLPAAAVGSWNGFTQQIATRKHKKAHAQPMTRWRWRGVSQCPDLKSNPS
jgi:hypothetical protein